MAKNALQRRAALSLVVTLCTYFLAVTFFALPFLNDNWGRYKELSIILSFVFLLWGSGFIWIRVRALRSDRESK